MKPFPALKFFAFGADQLAKRFAQHARILAMQLCMLLPVWANAQTFDPAWAAKLQSTLDSVALADGIRGVSAAVYAPGMGTWQGVHGLSAAGVPVTPDMAFGIGSNTKLFIAVLMVKLQEQGVLSLDDQLHDWLPSFPYVDSSATLRQLLNHQTGFFDYINDNNLAFWKDSIWADTSRVWTDLEVMASIGPPHFAPGEGYSYSNTNYVLAGMVIEAATGQPWYQQLRSQILAPLNLDSTFAGYYEAKVGTIAHALAYDSIEITHGPITSEYTSLGAPGGMISTCSEMLQWYSALFTGQVISDSSLQQIEDFEPVYLYGLALGNGLIAGWAGAEMSYHTGQMLGYCSVVMFDHRTGAVLCVLTNNSDLGASMFRPMVKVFDQFPLQPVDAGISQVLHPSAQQCSAVIAPQVVIKNFGINPLTSATIHYSFDQGVLQSYAWSGFLNTHDSAVVLLPASTLAWGAHALKCYTSLPNGANDGVPFNDAIEVDFLLSNTAQPAVYLEDFEHAAFPPPACSVSPASVTGWRRTSLVHQAGHACLVKNNFHDRHQRGVYDFGLPYLNLSSSGSPELSFDYAYTYKPGMAQKDSLIILLSTDCGATWDTLLHKGGNGLRTAPPSLYIFVPQANQWRQELVLLAGYSGDVLIRFREICYSGNNLYLDNIRIDNANAVLAAHPVHQLSIYPNPFTEAATLALDDKIIDGTLVMYDAMGREVQRMHGLAGKEIRIERKNLAPGLYTFILSDAEVRKGSGKLVLR